MNELNTDVLQRLRRHGGHAEKCTPDCLYNQAADEIERLRAENADLKGTLITIRDGAYGVNKSPAFECARLAHQALRSTS